MKKDKNASNSLRQMYPLIKLQELFAVSLQKNQISLKELLRQTNKVSGNSYTYRQFQHMRRWIEDNKHQLGLVKPYSTMLALLKDVASLPFFWDDERNTYIPADNIISLVQSGILYPPELENPQGKGFQAIVQQIQLLNPKERFLIAKIAINSVGDDLFSTNDDKITLSPLAYFRLPTLLIASLNARGWSDDYLEAANNLESLPNDEMIVEFAAFLQLIVERRIPGMIKFDQTAIAALAELCCEICEWKSDGTVIINPNSTYVGRVSNFIEALSNNTSSNVYCF